MPPGGLGSGVSIMPVLSVADVIARSCSAFHQFAGTAGCYFKFNQSVFRETRFHAGPVNSGQRPGIEDARNTSGFRINADFLHSIVPARCRNEKSPDGPQIHEGGIAGRPVREELDRARVRLHQALIDHRRKGKVLNPDAHSLHKREGSEIIVAPPGHQIHIGAGAIGQEAVMDLPFEAFEI